jgi:hypothetical protein
MSAYGKVAAILGDYRYSVSPELAISESISGIAVLKESFTVGQQVKIIQIGDGETSAAEFGFASVAANLKPVVAVTDSVKPAVIDASPASFMAAYIASAANKFTRLYELATVISSGVSSLVVKYITGRLAGSQRSIRCIDVNPASFIAGEIALIDSWQYGYDVVVGWWVVARLIWITVTINAIAGGGGTVNIVDDKGFYDETFYPWRSSKQFDPGSKLTATAWVHPADHVFAGWSGDIESSNTVIQFEPTKDTNLTINSTRLPVPYYIVGNNYCTAATTTMQMETPNQPATFTAEPKLTRSLRTAVRTETAAEIAETEYDAYTEIEYNADFTYDLTTLANADQWDKDSGRYWHKITISGTFVNVNIRNRYASQGADGDIQYWYRVTRDDGYTNTTYGALAPGQIAWINYASEHTLSATVYIRPIRYTCVYWYRQYNYYMQSAVVWALSNKFQATINAPESSNLNTQQQNTFYPQVAVTYLPNPFNEE